MKRLCVKHECGMPRWCGRWFRKVRVCVRSDSALGDGMQYIGEPHGVNDRP